MNDFKYIIFNVSEQNVLNLSELLPYSADPVRRSNNGIDCYVKYKNEMPPSVQILTTRSQEYTYNQISNILENENWNTDIPF